MNKTLIVKIDNSEKFFCYFDENINIGDSVIIKVNKEIYLGEVIKTEENLKIEETGSLIRLATKEDIIYYQETKQEEKKIIHTIREISKKFKLNIKIINVFYTFDKKQLVIYFLSSTRVDFRSFAKSLAGTYKTRIELRQIGVRDEAKKVGGIGCCGQVICCNRFLNTMDSVSIGMAKNQNMSLNPNSINGICGRLLCCLKYENETYVCQKKKLPKMGEILKEGKVVSIDVLNMSYTVQSKNGEQIKVDVKHECCK